MWSSNVTMLNILEIVLRFFFFLEFNNRLIKHWKCLCACWNECDGGKKAPFVFSPDPTPAPTPYLSSVTDQYKLE